MTRSSLIVLACAAAFAVSVLLSARKLRVSERHTLAWLLISAAIASLAIWRDGIDTIAKAMGIFYAPSALFFVVCGGLLLFVYRLSLEVSLLRTRVTRLAQEVAILTSRHEEPAVLPAPRREGQPDDAQRPARLDIAS